MFYLILALNKLTFNYKPTGDMYDCSSSLWKFKYEVTFDLRTQPMYCHWQTHSDPCSPRSEWVSLAMLLPLKVLLLLCRLISSLCIRWSMLSAPFCFELLAKLTSGKILTHFVSVGIRYCIDSGWLPHV